MKRFEISATGLSTDSLRDTCCVVTQDTALILRRRVFSYQRSALGISPLPFRKSDSALRNTIASSSA
jgi:hypothetical protein